MVYGRASTSAYERVRVKVLLVLRLCLSDGNIVMLAGPGRLNCHCFSFVLFHLSFFLL